MLLSSGVLLQVQIQVRKTYQRRRSMISVTVYCICYAASLSRLVWRNTDHLGYD